MTANREYADAIQQFKANLNSANVPADGEDARLWNLSGGLECLARALEKDMDEVKRLLSEINNKTKK